MRRDRPISVLPLLMLTCVSAIALVTVAASLFYPNDPLPGHTGGFGEPTCRTCHFDNDLNDPAGLLEITGLPDEPAAGKSYLLGVRIEHPKLRRAGFQLSARTTEGQQAGELQPVDESVAVTVAGEQKIHYVHHSAKGAERTRPPVAWQFIWAAPESAGPVVFHAAGNAANGDDSEFGDHVYVLEKPLTVK